MSAVRPRDPPVPVGPACGSCGAVGRDEHLPGCPRDFAFVDVLDQEGADGE